MLTMAIGVHAETEWHPWFALSTLWGQGNVGTQVNHYEKIYGVSYNFVSGWLNWDFSYHEVAVYTIRDQWTFGGKYRRQLSQDEVAPYTAYFIPLKDRYFTPMSIYNEAEYRINSVVKDGDYVRTRHIFTMYAPDSWIEAIYMKPYAALDGFMDWEDVEREKMRLNIGYFIPLKKAVARVYFIPWNDGIREEEWDDRARIGATLIYKW